MSENTQLNNQVSAKLYIVATPIGNISDITYRAVDILKGVDLIAAEDTRHSGKLLSYYQINTPMMAVHDHNERQRGALLIEKIKAGQSVALISDAGTPLISDPGYHLVNDCREAGVDVVPIPGACAAVSALSAAGLPSDRFSFEGFLPVKEKAKREKLAALSEETQTMIFYEAPRRIQDSVKHIIDILGAERKLVIARELTKMFESFYVLPAGEMLQWLQSDENHCRGEFVLMVAGNESDSSELSADAIKLLTLLKNELPLKKAAAITAEMHGLKKNELYKWGLENL